MRAGTKGALAAAALAVALFGCTRRQEVATSAESPRTWAQDAELLPDVGPAHRAFGQALALSGPALAVAETGNGEGSVYLYRRETPGWRREARLTHPAGLRDAGFGFALALSGGTLVVGVPGEGDGAAYVYAYRPREGGWLLQARLAAPAPRGYFGRALALQGDLVVVGAPTDGGTGAAYLFRRSGTGAWEPAGRLTGRDTGTGDFFGGALALDGNHLVVGAALHDDVAAGAAGAVAPRRGAAYVFALGNGVWAEEAELCSCDASAWDYLGSSVGLSGDTAVVGNAKQHAAAHVFVRGPSGWLEEAELHAAEDEPQSAFGHQVAVSGDWAVVGAPFGREGLRAAGEAYAFRRTSQGWTRYQLLDTDDPGAHLDCFGDAVAIDGESIAVAASADDDAGADLGAVYVYRLR